MEFSTSYPSIPGRNNPSPPGQCDEDAVKKWSSVPVLTGEQELELVTLIDLDFDDRPAKTVQLLNESSPPPSPPSSPVGLVVSSKNPTATKNQNISENSLDEDYYGRMDGGEECELIGEGYPSIEDPTVCDLICQIDGSGGSKAEVEFDMTSSFDDNGNFVDEDEEQGDKNEGQKVGVLVQLDDDDDCEKNPVEESRSRKGSTEENTTNNIMSDSGPKFQLGGFKSHLQHSVEGFLEEPKYFINAAALSEDLDTFTMPSLESIGTLEDCEIATTQILSRTHSKENNKEAVTPTNPGAELRENLPTVAVKPRVPMSKSFPDIIQTTFVDECRDFKGKKMFKGDMIVLKTEKDASVNDLTADSLEDLPTQAGERSHQQQQQQRENLHFDLKGETTNNLQDIMSMSQSQSQIGILAEKPPEAWVIDLNSLSLDSEAFENSEMSSSIKSSNPSSLAYFIDIDEKCPMMESKKNVGGGLKSPEKKKIFSMFVDFGETTGASGGGGGERSNSEHAGESRHSNIKPSRLPVHRNVMNVLREGEPMSLMSTTNSSGKVSTSSSYSSTASYSNNSSSNGGGNKKRAFQYPSPISQHKTSSSSSSSAACSQASRKAAAKIQLLEATEKAKEGRREDPAVPPPPEPNMDTSTTSNRSSLHVATEFDMTFSSSFISSMETSGLEGEELCSKGPCFKLGKDLLRMFQDGINTDVKISVNGRILRAHKCILSSRSQYFAAIFSGQLLEKAGNTIELDGFSYNVVQFAMCHIYSGTNEIPDSIDLLELATLTDLLGLEGLRENISQTIRVKFCHNFHRPCTGCISGVLECLPIAMSYEMDELHRKMTKWICKHFVRIWPTKAFANLGDELIEKCLRYSVNHLSVDNILDITLGCDQLLTTMPTLRWTEPIFEVVNQLSKACVQFIGENFSQVLQSQRFLLFGKGQQWNISRIEGTFMEALTLLKPDEACLSHTALSRLIELGTETIDEVEWSTLFVEFLRMLVKEVERYLVGNGSKAVLSKYWETLGKDVQKRICQSSFLGYDRAGNKIVKGSTAAMTTKQPSQGRLTPSERSSSITSIKSTLSSKHGPMGSRGGHGNKGFGSATSSHGNVSSAKIASVRPIQNVFSTSSAQEPPTQSATTMPKPHHPPTKTRPQPTQLRRKNLEEKEKSFNNSPRNSVVSSSIASANRTPMNPLTPMTPSKPGPGMLGVTTSIVTAVASAKSTTSRASARTQAVKPEAAPPPASTTNNKPGFITNSARANLVSKPNLRQRNVASTTVSRGATPRTPNLSQPSRYASSLGISSGSSTSNNRANKQAHGSSGSDKSERTSVVSTPVIESAKAAATTTTRTNRAGSTVSGSRERASSKNQHHHQNSTASGSSSSSSRKTSAKTRTTGHSGGTVGGASTMAVLPDPMRDSVMSRSTMEMETGETKIRTLAEIGRSSTFSKDEPTILGKLDPHQTVNIDFS